jgi:hypothetical protein
MRPAFSILAVMPDGHPLWIESVENLEDARERLREVARNAPGDCFIYSEKTGVVALAIHSDLRPHSSYMIQKRHVS